MSQNRDGGVSLPGKGVPPGAYPDIFLPTTLGRADTDPGRTVNSLAEPLRPGTR